MTDKHTPGPWSYRSQPHDDWGIVRAGRWIICQARNPDAGDDLSVYRRNGTDPYEANARLIAAAPDYAEVAPDAAELLEHYAEYICTVKADDLERHPYLPHVQDVARGLRAAMTKATGAA